MKILAVTSGKGGVGKSTISLNIARQLSLRGKRTLLIDFDIHNKGVTGLFLPLVDENSSTLTRLVHESSDFSRGNTADEVANLNFITLTKDGSLFLFPASRPQEMIQWERFRRETSVLVQFFDALFQRMQAKFAFDAIVIDCYGGIDSLTVAAAGIADDTIIVNEPDLVTFSGTLELYIYLREQYSTSLRKPRIHFVINRITSRHSFAFLDREYGKHLAKLAIDDKILAYFSYDKLLIETFGDYPFFSEILPKGLFTKKIRLLVEDLWLDDPAYKGFSGLTEGKKITIFKRTVESLFADPERILRTTVTLPFWLLVPSAMLFALSKGWGGALDYRMIRCAFYTALGFLSILLAIVGCFEPLQISRWLWREATYRRRKRSLKRVYGRLYRLILSIADLFRASLPGEVGLLFLAGSIDYAWNQRSRIQLLSTSIWPAEISGFSRGGNYHGLTLHPGARIKPGSDVSHADLSHAHLQALQFENINLEGTNFTGADLSRAKFENCRLARAIFNGADLFDATLESSNAEGATFSKLELETSRGKQFQPTRLFQVHFDKVDLTGADFDESELRSTQFRGSSLSKTSFKNAFLWQSVFKDSIQVTEADFSQIRYVDYATAKTLRDSGVQIQLPPIPTTELCQDADCEYSRTLTRIAPAMHDLVESLILRGGRENWNAAELVLTELSGRPDRDVEEQGTSLLLTLLLRVTSGQPDQVSARNWCTWVRQNKSLKNWSWKIWDHDLPKLHLSERTRAKIDLVESSATGKVSPDEFCARWSTERQRR